MGQLCTSLKRKQMKNHMLETKRTNVWSEMVLGSTVYRSWWLVDEELNDWPEFSLVTKTARLLSRSMRIIINVARYKRSIIPVRPFITWILHFINAHESRGPWMEINVGWRAKVNLPRTYRKVYKPNGCD